MRMDTSGKVGIGTTSPTRTFTVKSAAANSTQIALIDNNSTNEVISIGQQSDGDGFLHLKLDDGTGKVLFDASGNSYINGGNVGIGTSSPDSILDIEGVHSQLRLTDSDDSKFVLFSYSSGKLIVRNNDTSTTDNIYALQEDGNFGIGTHSPSEKLHIATSSGDCTVLIEAEENSSSREPHLQLKGTNTSSNPIIEFGDSAGFPGTIEYENSDNSMRFGTNAAERMRLDSNGQLLIGTTSSLGISHSLNVTAANFSMGVNVTNATGEAVRFYQDGDTVGTISVTGSATAYNTSSDARLKDVTGSSRGLEVINALNPVAYNWKADGKADEGLIAQEVLEVVPNAVSGSEEEYYQMDYSKLVTHLVAGMKEQQEQIEQLKTEIQTLKGE
jgi:hypothetical protein